MNKKYTLAEAKLKIEHWCAYQERCQFEVENKLRTWELPYEQINQLLAELIATNFISEERFAEAYVSGKFNIKRWGKIKIKQHLKQKHISDYSINKALKTIDYDEYLNCINHLIAKKTKELGKVENAYLLKGKIHNYLASKGFEFSIVDEQLKDLLKQT